MPEAGLRRHVMIAGKVGRRLAHGKVGAGFFFVEWLLMHGDVILFRVSHVVSVACMIGVSFEGRL